MLLATGETAGETTAGADAGPAGNPWVERGDADALTAMDGAGVEDVASEMPA